MMSKEGRFFDFFAHPYPVSKWRPSANIFSATSNGSGPEDLLSIPLFVTLLLLLYVQLSIESRESEILTDRVRMFKDMRDLLVFSKGFNSVVIIEH